MYPEGVVEVDIECVKLIPGMEAIGQTLACVLHSVWYASENKKVVLIFCSKWDHFAQVGDGIVSVFYFTRNRLS